MTLPSQPLNIRVLMLLGVLWCALCCRAQSDTTVSLVTVYPGSEIYEQEGHTALRINLGAPGHDWALNFGVFDFAAPNFMYRFVKGETDYMAAAYPWQMFMVSYAGTGRRIVEQPLRLDSEQKARLLELVDENLRPENRTYRYNYVLDNCATRPLALIEKALGDTIALNTSSAESEGCDTFRKVMRRYHRGYPWYQFGIDLALGSLIDKPITRREQTFAPVSLMEQMRDTEIAPAADEKVLADYPAKAGRANPTPWWLSPDAFAWAILVIVIALTSYDLRKRRLSRGFDAAFFGVLGLTGCLLTFLVFISVHYATSPNWLLAWLNPFGLIPTIFIWTKRGRSIVFWYQIINFAAVILLVAVWPFTGQTANSAFWPLIAATLLRSANYIYKEKPKHKPA